MKVYLLASVLALVALHGSSPLLADDKPNTEGNDANEQEENDDGDKPVAVADLPKSIVDSAATAQTGGEITEAELENEDGVTVYNLNVVNNGKKYEVKVDATGKVVSNKIDDDDDGEEDDDGLGMDKD